MSETEVRQRVYQTHLEKLLENQRSAGGRLDHAARRLKEAEANFSQAEARYKETEVEIQELRELAAKDGVALDG